jgi:hypothetical protein
MVPETLTRHVCAGSVVGKYTVKSREGCTCDQSVIVLGLLVVGVEVTVPVAVGVLFTVIVPVGVPVVVAVAVAVVVALAVAVGLAAVPSSRNSTSGLPHQVNLERATREGVDVGVPPPLLAKLNPEQAIIDIVTMIRRRARARAGPVFLQCATRDII